MLAVKENFWKNMAVTVLVLVLLRVEETVETWR